MDHPTRSAIFFCVVLGVLGAVPLMPLVGKRMQHHTNARVRSLGYVVAVLSLVAAFDLSFLMGGGWGGSPDGGSFTPWYAIALGLAQPGELYLCLRIARSPGKTRNGQALVNLPSS